MALVNPTIGRLTREFTRYLDAITLEGVPETRHVHTANVRTSFSIKIIYGKAAAISGSGGVLVSFGTYADPLKFHTWESLTSSAIGDEIIIDLTRVAAIIETGESLVVKKQPGKTGAGIVTIQIDLKENR